MANDELRQERSELRDVKLAHFEQCELRIATQKAEVSELAKLMKGSVTDIWQAMEEIRHLAKEDGIRLTKHKELFGYREGHDEVKQAHVHAVVGAREVLIAAKFIEQVADTKLLGPEYQARVDTIVKEATEGLLTIYQAFGDKSADKPVKANGHGGTKKEPDTTERAARFRRDTDRHMPRGESKMGDPDAWEDFMENAPQTHRVAKGGKSPDGGNGGKRRRAPVSDAYMTPAERLEQDIGTIDRIIDHCVEKTYKVNFER